VSVLIVEPLAPQTACILSEVAPTPSGSVGNTGVNFGAEKRKEVRYATCDAAEISVLDTPGLQTPGVVRDVSRNGLRIELALAVSRGTRLKISLRKRAVVFVVARYCRRTGNTYQVGVEIESVYYPNHPSTLSFQLDSSGSRLEARELARSIVQHHLSFAIGNPHHLRSRLSPVSDGPI
jgi:PilZ domain